MVLCVIRSLSLYLRKQILLKAALWGERRDSNPRSPGPQPGALTDLATLTTAAKSLASRLRKGQFVKPKIRVYVVTCAARDSSKSSTIMSVLV